MRFQTRTRMEKRDFLCDWEITVYLGLDFFQFTYMSNTKAFKNLHNVPLET